MKRIFLWALALALTLALAGNALAAEGGMTLSDSQGGAGQTVYLTLELKETVEASAVGLVCEYDTDLLTAQPELSTWEQEGLLFAFEEGNRGVWASEKPGDRKGKLCVLAFQVNEGVAFDRTQVVCTVVFKDGATEKASYTVQGSITCQCTHEYGDWESAGSLNHSRVCALCGGKSTQPHSWDDGQKQTQPDGTTLLVRTCPVCKARTARDVSYEEGDSLLGTEGKEDDHVHTPGTLPEEEHDHETPQTPHIHNEGGEDPLTLWVILAVLVVFVAAGVWYVKKNR